MLRDDLLKQHDLLTDELAVAHEGLAANRRNEHITRVQAWHGAFSSNPVVAQADRQAQYAAQQYAADAFTLEGQVRALEARLLNIRVQLEHGAT